MTTTDKLIAAVATDLLPSHRSTDSAVVARWVSYCHELAHQAYRAAEMARPEAAAEIQAQIGAVKRSIFVARRRAGVA
jgi:hypothetical protein